MGTIIYSTTGLIHFIAAIVALVTGTAVLIIKKGTKNHKTTGYVYTGSMLVVNITAFMIYRLFGGFGIFHIAAFVSLLTVAAGMVPALFRKPKGSWLTLHVSFMYWSVMGLYAAFVSEILTRIPSSPFFGTIGIVTALIMLLAGIGFQCKKGHWTNIRI